MKYTTILIFSFLSTLSCTNTREINYLKSLKTKCQYDQGESCFKLSQEFDRLGKNKESQFFLNKSCELKIPAGCDNYANEMFQQGRTKDYEKYSLKSCKLNVAEGCLNYANSSKLSKSQIKKYLSRSCELGSPTGCSEAGKYAESVNEKVSFFTKSCDLGNDSYCEIVLPLIKDGTEINRIKKKLCSWNYKKYCK